MPRAKQIQWWDWVGKPVDEVEQLAVQHNYVITACTQLPQGLDIFAPSNDRVPNQLSLLVVGGVVKQITLG